MQQFSDNWHVGFIAAHLEAVYEGRIPNLLINIPPGAMKSLITQVFFPAWCMANQPSFRFLGISYDSELAARDNGQCRTIVKSRWFQELWGMETKVHKDFDRKKHFETEAGGYRLCTSTTGALTGQHPDVIAIDDPVKAEDAHSATVRDSVNQWWDNSVQTRGISRDVRRIVSMQRLHPDDLSGHILKKNGGSTNFLNDTSEWDHICLPMRAEENRMPRTRLGYTDPRSPGDLLWNELFNEERVVKLEKGLGSVIAAGQLQQRPVPLGGSMFKREWFEVVEDSVLGLMG